jgi:hypothetical protein
MRASLAFERRLSNAVLRRCVPTGLAAVGGVPGVDLNPDTPSIFRLGALHVIGHDLFGYDLPAMIASDLL